MYLFSDGFDHYVNKGAPASSIKRYLGEAGYAVSNESDSKLGIVDGTDEGSLAIKFTATIGDSSPASVKRVVGPSEAGLCAFGFGFRGTGQRLRIARVNDSVDVDWDIETGKIKVGDVYGEKVIILNAWLYIEVELDKKEGEIRVWANDSLQLTAPMSFDSSGNFSIEWGGSNIGTGTVEIDDFSIVDDTPGEHTGRVGPLAIITRKPTADAGPNDWLLVGSPSANHYPIMAQMDPGRPNAPYLQANIEGKEDMFSSNTVLPNANEVIAVSLVSYARKGDLDDRSIGMKIKTSSGESEVQSKLTEDYRFHNIALEQAPGSTPWTQEKVEGSMYGIVAR